MSEKYLPRRNPHLKGYNYAKAGWYFVTICTQSRAETLSKIVEGNVQLTEIGAVVQKEWLRSAEIRSEIELDRFVFMPNHLHAIVRILETSKREQMDGLYKHSLPSLIAGFKSSVTKQLRLTGLISESLWQRGYYERIIRDETELNRIRFYIANNPARWLDDCDNINAIKAKVVLVTK